MKRGKPFPHFSQHATTGHLSSPCNTRLVFPREAAAGFLRRGDQLSVSCGGNHWSKPPQFVVDRNLEAVVRYFESIDRSGRSQSWALKVVVVGAICAGKSSVVKSLLARKAQSVCETERTRGVEVHIREPFKPDSSRDVELVFWDFAGHDDYHSTHSLFLSRDALFLLVVDLAHFLEEPSSRSEAIHTWLDTLLCRTPGAVVQIIATHIDQLGDGYDDAVQQLREAVAIHLKRKYDEHMRGFSKAGKEEAPPTLRVIHEVHAVSCREGDDDWPVLGEALANCAADGTAELLAAPPGAALDGQGWPKGKLFPLLGQEIPRVWARAASVLDALRDGHGLHNAAHFRELVPGEPPIKHLRWEAAARKWEDTATAEGAEFKEEIGPGGAEVVLKVNKCLRPSLVSTSVEG